MATSLMYSVTAKEPTCRPVTTPTRFKFGLQFCCKRGLTYRGPSFFFFFFCKLMSELIYVHFDSITLQITIRQISDSLIKRSSVDNENRTYEPEKVGHAVTITLSPDQPSGIQVSLILPNQIAMGEKEWTMFPLRERGGTPDPI